jgi:hypothetical protein
MRKLIIAYLGISVEPLRDDYIIEAFYTVSDKISIEHQESFMLNYLPIFSSKTFRCMWTDQSTPNWEYFKGYHNSIDTNLTQIL